MKSMLLNISLYALIAFTIITCGGGNLAGIGGSGYISTGSITGFGSVFVNGVEFETDSAIFDVEDESSSQQALRIGMVVQVSGSINEDGITGTATEIRYGDQLEGPVDNLTINADGTEKSFRVMGNNVIVDSIDTVFEGTGFSFDSIVDNNLVEISGYYDQNEVLRATYIKLKATTFTALSIVEIEGYINGLSGSSFTVRNVNIDASAANLVELSNGLQNGIHVEVKGTYNISSNTISAIEVEEEDISFVEDGSEVEIEGYVTRYVSNSDFDIDGHKVNATNAVFEPAALEQELRAGIKVEAEGGFSNGVLTASEIETSSGDAKIHAFVGSVNASAGTFTLVVVSNQSPVSIMVDTGTTLEDELTGLDTFNLSDLSVSDFVEVVGFETSANMLTATKVKRVSALEAEVTLQGMATAATAGGTITILGVEFPFNGATKFENDDEVELDAGQISALISTINSTPTLLNISDTDGDEVADEIDLE